MVKPTVFSVEAERRKSLEQRLNPLKETPSKFGIDDEEPLVAERTEVCTMQRCACSLVLILIGLGCLVGAGVGLYIHLNNRQEPTFIITGARPGHPYGNDALFPPDFHHRPAPFGGRGYGRVESEFHHGSQHGDPMRPPPPFPPGDHPHPPFNELPFAHDAFEPPHPHAGGMPHHAQPRERPAADGPRGPNGRHHGLGIPHRDRAGMGPEYELHHGAVVNSGNQRRQRPYKPHHGQLP